MLKPACHLPLLTLARCHVAREGPKMPSLARGKPPSPHQNGLPSPCLSPRGASLLFLLRSPGDWHNLLDEEELKGVSMATAGPAPY